MPWRNGGGVTYEVASSPADSKLADFDWRVSIAEVQGSGPFSAFDGVDRTIILVEGEWMELTVDGRPHRFGVRQPFRFDGGGDTTCKVAGPSRDLNVMTRRGRATATVAISEAGGPGRGPVEAHQVVFVCLSGSITLTDPAAVAVELTSLDAAIAGDGVARTIHGDGAVAVIELQAVVGAEP